MPGTLRVDPASLLAAAAELDAVAARVTAAMTAAAVALRPLPAGGEEVSLLAARYFTTSAHSFDAATSAAVAELHETAAALRAQAAAYQQSDTAFSVALSAGVA